MFYVPTVPISCSYFTLGNCQDLNISKKYIYIKISREDAIMINKSMGQNGMVRKGY